MEEQIALSIHCNSFEIVDNGDESSFDKIMFNLKVELTSNRSYQIQRSYVDFVDFDSKIRKEMNLNVNLPLTNIHVVEGGMMLGIYPESKEKKKLKGNSGLKLSSLSKVKGSSIHDISVLPNSIVKPDPSIDLPLYLGEKNNWIQAISSIVQSIGKSRDIRSYDWIRLKEEDLLSTVSELDFYLQTILSRHEIVASVLFSLFFDPESFSMTNTNERYDNSMDKTNGISVPELLLTDTINVQTRIRGVETKKFEIKEGHFIVWKFIVMGFDIGFSIFVNGECRMSNTRCNGLQYGAMVADVDGCCELIWDNSYSIFRSKQLVSAVRVVETEIYHAQEIQVREILQGKVHMQDLRNILELSILYHVKRLSGIMYHRKGSTERLLAAEEYLHREEQLQEFISERDVIEYNRENLTSSCHLMIQEGIKEQTVAEIDPPRDLGDHTCIGEETSVPIPELDDDIDRPSIEKDNQSLDIWNQNDRKTEKKSDDILNASCPQRCLKASSKAITIKKTKKGKGNSVKHDKVKSHVSFARSALAEENPLMRIRTKLVEYKKSTVITDSPLSSPDFLLTPMPSPYSTSPSSVLSSLDTTSCRMYNTAVTTTLFSSSETSPEFLHLQPLDFSSKSEGDNNTSLLDIKGIPIATKSPNEGSFERNRKTGLKAGMINYDYDEVKKAIYTEAQLSNTEKLHSVRENIMNKIASLSDDYNMRTESLMQRAEEREKRVTQSIMDDMDEINSKSFYQKIFNEERIPHSIENVISNQLCINDGCNSPYTEIEDVGFPQSNEEQDDPSEWSSCSSRYSSEPTTASPLLDASPTPSGLNSNINIGRTFPSSKYTHTNEG